MEISSINPVNAYLLTIHSPATIESCTSRLRHFCQFAFNNKKFDLCQWVDLNYIDVLGFMQHQRESGLVYASINVSLSIIKNVALQAWQLDIISIEQYMRIKTIKGLKGERIVAGRALSIEEVTRVKQAYNKADTPSKCRNYAIFALAVGTGLRRNEIFTLNIENFTGNKLIVTGKRNKTRTLYLSEFVKKAVDRWLFFHDEESGALFVRIFTSGNFGERIGEQSIHKAIESLQRGFDFDRFTTHDLRRTFATTLLDVGADKFAVQRLMGHSSLNTTELYDRRGEKAAKAAIDLLPF